MAKKFILEEMPDIVLDQILALTPKAKNHYFKKLTGEFYPNLIEDDCNLAADFLTVLLFLVSSSTRCID